MQALILAAGLGLRLGELTRDKTKAMVEVNGRTLIERALEALADGGVARIGIVVGHGAEALRSLVGPSYRGMPVVYYENPVYRTTNNIYSLWLAREFLAEDDTVLLESDLVFEPRLLEGVLKSPHENVAVVAKFESWMDGTVTLLDEQDHIVAVVPKEVFDWREVERYYKTVNIYKFSKAFSNRFYLPFLGAYIEAFGRSRYYEQVLKVITYLSQTELKAHRVTDERWYEIDDALDLDIARTLFAEGEERIVSYEKRYGGYWRFPKLRDFCYLVNPYFPDARLFDELRANLPRLAASYPSGQRVQALLASALLGCDASEVAVGNGASEVITVLGRTLPGPFGVPAPSFEEYARAAQGHAEVVRFAPDGPDFSLTVSGLVQQARALGTLVLSNPENPTGQFLERGAVLDLLEQLSGRGTCVVLDESFIEFAGDPAECSLLSRGVLARYPRLVIVKSISKSYGVPGLRLGMAVSGDRELIAKLAAGLSIWNVNSLAESFLQIFGKYRRECAEAFRRVREDRVEMHRQLAAVPFLRVLPSRANFFLCEVTGGLSAGVLARELLERHDILIKDCTGKPGLEHGEYVRLAIRGREDNASLVSALRTLSPSA